MNQYYEVSGEEYPHTVKRRKADWIGHIWHRNYFLKHAIEGNVKGRIEVTGRRGRRRKQLRYDVKEEREDTEN